MGTAAAGVRAPDLADWLLARGISSLTTPEVADYLNVPEDQVRRRLHAPRQRGQWVSPTHGLWIAVQPEFRTWGAPPGIEVVDLLMRHLGAGYYVGWLSAAELNGAAHQAPQVFQVAVSRPIRDRQVGRTRFEFQLRGGLEDLPVVDWPIRSGSARVATPELTMLDVTSDIQLAGGIDNAAIVLVELAENERFDVASLAQLSVRFATAAARRVGWILENFAGLDTLDALHGSLASRAATPSILDPFGPSTGVVDRRWQLRINRDLDDVSS